MANKNTYVPSVYLLSQPEYIHRPGLYFTEQEKKWFQLGILPDGPIARRLMSLNREEKADFLDACVEYQKNYNNKTKGRFTILRHSNLIEKEADMVIYANQQLKSNYNPTYFQNMPRCLNIKDYNIDQFIINISDIISDLEIITDDQQNQNDFL